MTKREKEDQARTFKRLEALGFTHEEWQALRRISMTLRRWYEAECNGEIERDEATRIPYRSYPSTGRHLVHPLPDREAVAHHRLSAIMIKHPGCIPYLQTDPRGCALYIISREALHAMRAEGDSTNELVAQHYSAVGIPVY